MSIIFEETKTKVLDIIKNENNKPIPIGVIVKKIKDIDPHINKHTIYKVVDYLQNNRFIKKNRFEKYILDYVEYEPDYSKYFECTIDNINKGMNGFASYINENNEKVTFFIQNNDLNEAILKDKVLLVKLKKPDKDKKEDELDYARVTKILKRGKECYSAILLPNNNFSLDDTKFYLTQIFDSNINVKKPTRILVRLKKIKNKKAYFNLEKIIGEVDAKGSDIDSIILDSGFKLKIDSEVEESANSISFSYTDDDKKNRRDLRNKEVISIDPKGSKDLDDAICVEQKGNNYLLTVCIADVSFYVKQDSILDKDAFEKSTSTYLPDRVLPMLPENLSNNICSLNENVDRFCLACEIEIDSKNGNVISKQIFPAIIRNRKSFSYDEVNNFFDTNELIASDSLKNQLLLARKLFKLISEKKSKKGYVELDIKEPKIICDENGKVIDIVILPRYDAQKMIEDFMVLCNEAVTKIALDFKLPFIYRVHDKPDILKLKKLKTELEKMQFLGAKQISDVELTQKDLSMLIEKNKCHPLFNILNLMLLMSMSKATYEITNIGHYGLALDDYTHFTSPIRRYSDLIVHRIFWLYLFAPSKYTDEQRNKIKDNLQMICEQCNKQEVAVLSLEREVIDYKIAEYMEDKIGKVYEAIISTVTSFGIFVTLDNCVEGLIPINSLHDDYYNFDQDKMILVGKTNNRIFTLGQKVKVKLVSVDKKTRKIDFALISKDENIINEQKCK